MNAARDELEAAGTPRRPMIVKIAPDIADDDLPAIVARLVAHKVDGIAVSNTTLARTGLNDAQRVGSRAGFPAGHCFERATIVLARVYRETTGAISL